GGVSNAQQFQEYSIDPVSGNLSLLRTENFNTVANNAGVDFIATQTGFLYGIDTTASPGILYGYSVGPSGALTPLPSLPSVPVLSSVGGVQLLAHPSGKFLYAVPSAAEIVGGPQTAGIFGFAVDPATGNLTSIPGSPFDPTFPFTNPVAISNNGQYIYSQSDQTSTPFFAVDPTTGALTATVTAAPALSSP